MERLFSWYFTSDQWLDDCRNSASHTAHNRRHTLSAYYTPPSSDTCATKHTQLALLPANYLLWSITASVGVALFCCRCFRRQVVVLIEAIELVGFCCFEMMLSLSSDAWLPWKAETGFAGISHESGPTTFGYFVPVILYQSILSSCL